jgi:hypothetical protein
LQKGVKQKVVFFALVSPLPLQGRDGLTCVDDDVDVATAIGGHYILEYNDRFFNIQEKSLGNRQVLHSGSNIPQLV